MLNTIKLPKIILKKNSVNCIAIIGGGPAAISFCLQLIEKIKVHAVQKPFKIFVFEKNKKIGPGLPYLQKEPSYILNLPKEVMDPVFEKKGNFTRWLKINCLDIDTAFPPRYLFGKYLTDLAFKVQVEAKNYNIDIKYFPDTKVLNINKIDTKFIIKSRISNWVSDYVVLATGCMPPEMYRDFIGRNGYWHNSWDNEFFLNLKGTETIGIIGTRLSAIDAAVRLLNSGHKGLIVMGSRSGLLPSVLAQNLHSYPLKYLRVNAFSSHKPVKLESLIELLFKEISLAEGKPCDFNSIVKSYRDISVNNWLNKEIYAAENKPKKWQQVLFESYSLVPLLWSRLQLMEQTKFMKQYYSLYMTYLAAFPLTNAYKIRSLLQCGQLKVVGGVDIGYKDKTYLFRNDLSCIKTQCLLNATGPGYNVIQQSLYQKLIEQNLIQRHPLGGLCVNEELEVFNQQGKLTKGLFAVGELTKGTFLATTDMQRVAQQTDQIATSISKKIGGITKELTEAPKRSLFFSDLFKKKNYNSIDNKNYKLGSNDLNKYKK